MTTAETPAAAALVESLSPGALRCLADLHRYEGYCGGLASLDAKGELAKARLVRATYHVSDPALDVLLLTRRGAAATTRAAVERLLVNPGCT